MADCFNTYNTAVTGLNTSSPALTKYKDALKKAQVESLYTSSPTLTKYKDALKKANDCVL